MNYIIRHELHSIHTRRHTNTQTQRQTDKQTGRQTGRQTYIQYIWMYIRTFILYVQYMSLKYTVSDVYIERAKKNAQGNASHEPIPRGSKSDCTIYRIASHYIHEQPVYLDARSLQHYKKTVPWVTRYLLNINTLRSQHGLGGWRCPAL